LPDGLRRAPRTTFNRTFDNLYHELKVHIQGRILMYPASYHVDRAPTQRDRLSVGLRYLFALPWMFIAGLWGMAAYVAAIVSWFSIVLGRGYPPALYEFNVKYLRMASRANAFFLLQTDTLPPFDGEVNDHYPVRINIDPDPGVHDRLSVALRGLYLIPVYIVIWLVSLVGYVGAMVTWFSIVLGGRVSDETTELTAKALASVTRATAYALLLTDRYPPAWDENPVIGMRPGSDQPPAVTAPPTTPTPVL
jgi:hypothetical protein